MSELPSARTILLASAGALLGAAVLLLTIVLPAELGIDPIGSGRLLGLTDLAAAETRALREEIAPFAREEKSFVLEPFESFEYKYRLEKGSTLLFAWRASGPLEYDLHAEPDGAPEGFATSFARGEAAEADGAYQAPFPGIHGWFFENRGAQPVTLRLVTSGHYSLAKEFREGLTTDHEPEEAL